MSDPPDTIEQMFDYGGGCMDVVEGVRLGLGQSVLRDASPEVQQLCGLVTEVVTGDLPGMGLGAGSRPAADVEALLAVVASAEFELARRMHAGQASGSLPLVGQGAMPRARGWSSQWSRRLAVSAELADRHPELAVAWASGLVTSEHIHALHRHGEALTDEERAAVVRELAPLWGQLSPGAVGRFVQAAVRMLHPPPDPAPDERDAHEARHLSCSVLGDTVILSGALPRLEGELVMAAVDAFAERLRTEADHVPADARRADGLVALVTSAIAAGAVPSRGGVPVALTVTLDSTAGGDSVWSTSRGHVLTPAEQRFVGCDSLLTPVVVGPVRGSSDCSTVGPCSRRDDAASPGDPLASRLAGLAAVLLGQRVPLALGRSQRTASEQQRRALAARDRGCIIPGCSIVPEACQAHHLVEWSRGGSTDVSGMVLLCWSHHRQVELGMWRIEPVLAHGSDVDFAGPTSGEEGRDGWWAANRGAPWRIVRQHRSRWRL